MFHYRPKDAIKAIKKRLSSNVGKNYQVIMYSLTVSIFFLWSRYPQAKASLSQIGVDICEKTITGSIPETLRIFITRHTDQ